MLLVQGLNPLLAGSPHIRTLQRILISKPFWVALISLAGVSPPLILLYELVGPKLREQQGIASALRIPLLTNNELAVPSLVTTVLWVDPHAVLISLADRNDFAGCHDDRNGITIPLRFIQFTQLQVNKEFKMGKFLFLVLTVTFEFSHGG